MGCLPYQVASKSRDSFYAVLTDNLASTYEQKWQIVEREIASQAKRLKELKLQQRKRTLLPMNKEAHQIEHNMQLSCRFRSDAAQFTS